MKAKLSIVLLISAVITAGCSLIDDDLSVCGTDYLVNYRMRLVTEVHTTIDETLSSETEQSIADTLKKWSEPYFSGYAHDLDMNFYSLDGTGELQYHRDEIINATGKSYTLSIPRQNYQHLAVVNTADNGSVILTGGQYASSLRIVQRAADTLASYTTSFYTARQPMHINETDTNISFDVHLYMASCALAVVAQDSTGGAVPAIQKVVLTGTATGFNVNDSVYTFEHPSVIVADQLTEQCFTAVSLPSASAGSPASSPAHAPASDLWQIRIYALSTDGTVTENILRAHKPLKAGTLEIVKVYMHEDGSVETDAEMGVSVTLDWKEGNEHDITTG